MLLVNWFVNWLRWYIKNDATMHSTENIRSSNCVLSTSWILPPPPNQKNSPDLHDLEKLPLSRLKIRNSIVIQKTFIHAIEVNWLNHCVVKSQRILLSHTPNYLNLLINSLQIVGTRIIPLHSHVSSGRILQHWTVHSYISSGLFIMEELHLHKIWTDRQGDSYMPPLFGGV